MAVSRAPVLLYVLYPSHFKVMFRVARALAETGRFTPIVFFDRSAPYERDLAVARDAGIACLGPDGQPAAPAGPAQPGTPGLLDRVARAVAHVPRALREPAGDVAALAGFVPKLALDLAAVRGERQRYRDVLRAHRIRLVIAPGDNVGYGTPALFAEAHAAGACALIVPFTISNRLEMVADLRQHRKFSARRLENRLVAALYPHWALENRGHHMVRLPASTALALEWNGLAPKEPWVLNSGAADALAVESRFMWDYYVRAGIPESQLRLTGTIGDDVIARMLADAPARRAALAAQLGLAPGRKIVLFSYGEYHYFFQHGRTSEFSSQAELTRFWLDALSAMPGYDVVLSLHPSLRREDVAGLAGSRVKIASWPIEELIPLCDVFAASISATVRIAIACGKPVVDHDVFDFDYDNFVGLDAVWIAKTREQFAGTLLRLASDETFARNAVAAQQAVAPRFGELDGKSTARIMSLVDELVGHEPAVRARGAAGGS